jgi:predicted nucleic acid-binding protein
VASRVFADTLYWVGLINRRDPWSDAVTRIASDLEASIVTTDEVLVETLGFLSASGPHLRAVAFAFVRALFQDPIIQVVPQSRESFLGALDLYASRLDKGYSLVDCRSMVLMRELGIEDVLTGDRHFAQEGFRLLLREN